MQWIVYANLLKQYISQWALTVKKTREVLLAVRSVMQTML